ncbi:MAG: hypothetical protein ACYC6T_13525 [Thermoleophilia bacterium]
MRKTLLLLVLITLLAAALTLPAVAMAAPNPYGAYGNALRATYGASLGQNAVGAPNSYGVRLGQQRVLTSQSYGVRLGHVRVLTTQTYGSRLANPTGNQAVVPFLPATADPSVWAW